MQPVLTIAASTAEPTPLAPPLGAPELEALWRGLCKRFREIKLFDFSRNAVTGTFQAYGSLSNDHVTLNASREPWHSALSTLSALNEKEIEFLSKLSEANCELLDMHVKRKAALYFAIYPALISGLAKTFFGDDGISIFPLYAYVFAFGGIMFMNFYMAKWRAIELDNCVKMALARMKLMNEDGSTSV
jgi:hypothetical protein